MGALAIPDMYEREDEARDDLVYSRGVGAEIELEEYQGSEADIQGMKAVVDGQV